MDDEFTVYEFNRTTRQHLTQVAMRDRRKFQRHRQSCQVNDAQRDATTPTHYSNTSHATHTHFHFSNKPENVTPTHSHAHKMPCTFAYLIQWKMFKHTFAKKYRIEENTCDFCLWIYFLYLLSRLLCARTKFSLNTHYIRLSYVVLFYIAQYIVHLFKGNIVQRVSFFFLSFAEKIILVKWVKNNYPTASGFMFNDSVIFFRKHFSRSFSAIFFFLLLNKWFGIFQRSNHLTKYGGKPLDWPFFIVVTLW